MLNWLQKGDYVKLAVERRLCLTGCRKGIMLNWLQKGDYAKLVVERGFCLTGCRKGIMFNQDDYA